MATELKLNFAFKYDTKGAVRYQELDKNGNHIEIRDGAHVGPLYIRKTTLKGRVPVLLSVTIKGD